VSVSRSALILESTDVCHHRHEQTVFFINGTDTGVSCMTLTTTHLWTRPPAIGSPGFPAGRRRQILGGQSGLDPAVDTFATVVKGHFEKRQVVLDVIRLYAREPELKRTVSGCIGHRPVVSTLLSLQESPAT
jgi:hypothetical protein